MMHMVARSLSELDWQSMGGYNIPEQVTSRREAIAMAGQRNSNLRGSAQPHNFRGHGQFNSLDSLAHSSDGLGVTQSTYSTAPYTTATVADNSVVGNNNWLPKDTTQSARVNHIDNSIQYAAEPWQGSGVPGPSRSQYQQTLTPRQQDRLPPSIQIGTYENQLPQASQYSQADFLVPQYQQFLAVNSGYSSQYDDEMSEHPAPVSPVSHQTGPLSRAVTPLPESTSRKRAYSEVSQDAPSRSPAGHGTILDTTSPEGYTVSDEQPAPRKSRTIKRHDAPMNEYRKYICNISAECAGLVFDRKCEWGKHMDKHDRPYRCPHASCAKLQGFTYSGGLLRHEREVHNKHGGPKAVLMCPHPNCKRHTEKGFTRKENLAEHVRRVHSDSADLPIAETHQDVGADQSLSAPSAGASADELYAAALNGSRRKRSTAQDDDIAPVILELREQVKRLTSENEAKAGVIYRLEDEARVQSSRVTMLENALQQMQQSVRSG